MKLADLKARMQELEIRSKRSLGQNFLVSDFVIDKIIAAAHVSEPNKLIEIGPGLGALTEKLADLKPLLIELDSDLAAFWRERGFEVIEADALKIDWNELPLIENTWLVSNLPYQISTHLVIDRCFGPSHLHGMILMFQKEVAQRLTSLVRTPNYGLLSVMAQNYWKISKVADAAPKDFFPPPKIASRVLKFVRKPSEDLDDGFLKFLKAAFSHRRKFMLKNLKQLGHKKVTPMEQHLESMDIGLKVRAEEVTPEQFAELYRRWKKNE